MTTHRAAPRSSTLILAAGALATLSSPAFGLAEAIQTICPDGPQAEVVCPWYCIDGGPTSPCRLSRGPVIANALPPEQQRLTGSRSVLGLIDGLFPLSSHEAFDDGAGGSKILVEIQAGLGEGNPASIPDRDLRSRATGVAHVMVGNGTPQSPEPLARGVAFDARLYVASIASSTSAGNTFVVNLPGMMASMLIMADPVTAAAFGITQTADAIVSAYSLLGDFEGEGFIARIHDAVAHMFGTTLIAPVGDGGAGPFPPTMPELQFRTVGSPATAFNTIAVGGTDITPPPPEPVDFVPGGEDGIVGRLYDRIWPRSGRGRTDARDWRTRDATSPTGFRNVPNVRLGPDIVAPAARLRTATAVSEADYTRPPALPEPPLQEGPGAQGTAYAAGFVAGAVALLQDGYRALRATGSPDFAHWPTSRMHNALVKALLLNSARKSAVWTNQGNQGPNSAPPQPFTTQPLDTLEGAGHLQLTELFRQFQGRPPSLNVPGLTATMDVAITTPQVPLVRDPRSAQDSGMGLDNDPPIGGIGSDPPLGQPGGGGLPPSGPFIPGPDTRPSAGGGASPTQGINPLQQFIIGAFPVHSIGWDLARIGIGYLDYACVEPAVGNDTFTATLCWNRTEILAFPTITPTSGNPFLNLETDELALKLEDLTLQLFLHDGSGGPRILIAGSTNDWTNTEHIFMPNNNIPVNGVVLVRVRWNRNRYNTRAGAGLFVGDQVYGVAWKLNQGNVGNPGNIPPETPVVMVPGDLNGDRRVDVQDLTLLLSVYGTNDPQGDANHDGRVDFLDLSLVLGNFGAQGGPVPTP